MGSEEIGDRRNNSSFLNCPSSLMATNSISDNVARMSMCSEMNPFYSSGWDTIVSGDQTGNYLGNSCMVHENEFVDMVQKIPSFGSGSFSEMVSQNSEDGALGALLNGKRKRKNVEEEQQKDQTGNSSELPEEEEKKNVSNKQAAKQAKSNSNGAEPSKEDYILVRAKRGQATNSHSLAERVRREKISERMRLLQELVPGCNKITGKAVMLDEIINYVQSLQQQVEFLSMKLATVNPELNVDIERLLSKDDFPMEPSMVSQGQRRPFIPYRRTYGTMSCKVSSKWDSIESFP
ncbi:hypothetical protein DH2020_035501 [Rehmannia glutinosa]|uniref:BHLH domain-containing protein n=1 Tax=Rehmannia glutinosa TaxID=99300 RepID=A0ABR0V8H8_REHGL